MVFYVVGCLLGALVWDILRLTIFGDVNMRNNMVAVIITCILYVACAALLFLSMKENEKVLMYFGFLKGALAKSIFLLFCTGLIFPLKPTEVLDENGKSIGLDGTAYINIIIGYVLCVASFLQICKYCRRNKDSNEQEAMMEDEKQENLVPK